MLQPAMKAREIADAGIKALRSGKYELVRLNFANPDMVAHTGDLDAAIEACSVVDKCVKVCVSHFTPASQLSSCHAKRRTAEERLGSCSMQTK